MKKLLFALFALALSACEKDPQPEINIDFNSTASASISATGATLSSNIVAGAEEFAKFTFGFAYGKASDNPSTYTRVTTTVQNNMIVVTLSGLQPATAYKFFAYAQNGGLKKEGATFTFTTLADGEPVPNFGIPSSSNITVSEAALVCDFSYSGTKTIEEVYFIYKDGAGTELRSFVSTGQGTKVATLSELTAGTTYTFWLNVKVGGVVYKSGVRSFTTIAETFHRNAWMELPAKMEGETLVTLPYFVSSQRNYTMLYDKSVYMARWVAYPLVQSHTGSIGRPSNWYRNTDIDDRYQIALWEGNYVFGSDSYVRGHQIPNGDRNGNAEMQRQTFYATNATPQWQNGFNNGIWKSLEDNIRSQAMSVSDTLYIATGPVFRTVGGNETINYLELYRDDKTDCPIPNYYYKVVLKCKRNVSGEVTSASTIGFWFEHRIYSAPNNNWLSYVTSVAEIEQLTGFDFFTNLPSNIASTAEQNTSWDAFRAF